jgi:hypothetical protein
MEHPMITQINRFGYPKKMTEKEAKPSATKQSQLFNIYECEDCILTFAVEQTDGLINICCPVCQDENISDIADGEIVLRR